MTRKGNKAKTSTTSRSQKKEQNEESPEGIMVAIRLRPLDDMERKNGQIWKILPQQSSVTQTKTSKTSGKPLKGRTMGKTFFTFDKTFGEEVNTKEVYDSCAKDIVKSTVNGLNGTIFAYGQTASGKTHTMQGSGSIKDESFTIEGGIIHMAAKDIFLQIQSQQNRIFLVRVSFFEIYNEEVRDLLSSSNEKLQVRHDGKGEICVQSVEEAVTDCQSLMTILFNGEKSRAVAATSMNQRSSRSHTIFRITIESREKDFSEDRNEETHGNDIVTTGAVRVSTLNLVDLAGSENVKRTGATGKRQKEGRMINQSLLALSRVIAALGNANKNYINFRDSKLTRVLQPSLSGNARMAVICCATPSLKNIEETRSTFQFASRAKLVKTNPRVNEIVDDRSIIRQLQRELEEVRCQNLLQQELDKEKYQNLTLDPDQFRALEAKAVLAETEAKETREKFDSLRKSILNATYLFGNRISTDLRIQCDASETGESSPKPMQRRLSDGDLFLKSTSPTKKDIRIPTTPKSSPKKRKRNVKGQGLSVASELHILRETVISRDNLTRSLKSTLNNQVQELQARDEAIANITSQNSALLQDLLDKEIELDDLRQMNDQLQLASEATTKQHESTYYQEVQSSLALQFSLEEASKTIESLRSEKDNLEARMSNLKGANMKLDVRHREVKKANKYLKAEIVELLSRLSVLEAESTEATHQSAKGQSVIDDMEATFRDYWNSSAVPNIASMLSGTQEHEDNKMQQNLSTEAKNEPYADHAPLVEVNQKGSHEEIELYFKDVEKSSRMHNSPKNEESTDFPEEPPMENSAGGDMDEGDNRSNVFSSEENPSQDSTKKGTDECHRSDVSADVSEEPPSKDSMEGDMNDDQSHLVYSSSASTQPFEEETKGAAKLRLENESLIVRLFDLQDINREAEAHRLELAEANKSYHWEIEEARRRISILEEEKAELEPQIKENHLIAAQFLDLKGKIIEAHHKVSALEEEKTHLELQLKEKNEIYHQLSDLEDGMTEIESKYQKLTKTNKFLQVENSNLHQQLDALKEDNTVLEFRLNSTAELLGLSPNATKHFFAENGMPLGDRGQDILDNLELHRLERKDLNTHSSGFQDDNNKSASHRQGLEELRTSLQGENLKLQQRLTALEEENSDFKSEIEKTKSEAVKERTEKEAYVEKFTGLFARVSSLQKELSSTKEQINRLPAENSVVDDVPLTPKTHSQIEILRSEKEKILARSRLLEEINAEIKLYGNRLEDTNDFLGNENQNLRKRLSVLEANKTELNSMVAPQQKRTPGLAEQHCDAAAPSDLIEQTMSSGENTSAYSQTGTEASDESEKSLTESIILTIEAAFKNLEALGLKKNDGLATTLCSPTMENTSPKSENLSELSTDEIDPDAKKEHSGLHQSLVSLTMEQAELRSQLLKFEREGTVVLSEMESNETLVSELEKRLFRLKEMNIEVEFHHNQLEKLNSNDTNENRDLQERLSVLQKEKTGSVAEKTVEFEARLSSLQETNEEIESHRNRLEKINISLANENRDLQERLSVLEAEKTVSVAEKTVASEFKARLSSLQETNEEIESHRNRLEKINISLANENRDLQERLSVLGAEKSDFRNHARFSQLIQLSLEEALRDLKTLRAENAAAHGSISALEAEKTKLESQIISFRKDPALRQVTSMQQELSRKDKQQNQYKDMFESLQSDYNKALVSNEKAFAQINQLQDEKDQAAQESKQFFQGIQTALEEVSRDLETLKLKKAELESKVRHLKGANSKLDSRRRKLEEVNTLLQTELLNIQGLRTPRELNQEGTPGKDPGGSKFLGMSKQNIFSFNSSSWSDREKLIQSRDENETVAEEMNETDPDGNLSLQADIRDESDELSGLVAQKREIEAQITFIGEAKAVLSGMRSQATTLTKMENHESALQEQVSTIETKMEKLRAVKEASVDKRVAHSGEVKESLEGLNSEKGGVLVSTLRSLSRGPPGKYPATHPKNKISNLRIDSALVQKNE